MGTVYSRPKCDGQVVLELDDKTGHDGGTHLAVRRATGNWQEVARFECLDLSSQSTGCFVQGEPTIVRLVAPEVSNGLEINRRDDVQIVECEPNDVSHLVVVRSRNDGRHQNDRQVGSTTGVQCSVFDIGEVRLTNRLVGLAGDAVELQIDRSNAGIGESFGVALPIREFDTVGVDSTCSKPMSRAAATRAGRSSWTVGSPPSHTGEEPTWWRTRWFSHSSSGSTCRPINRRPPTSIAIAIGTRN